MNQRRRNRRRHTTMLISQLIERRNSRRIAQNHGYLTATGHAGRLALGAGLGLGHSRNHQRISVVTAHMARASVSRILCRPASEWLAILANDEGSVCFSRDRDGGKKLGDFFGGLDFHGYLRSRPIPPMCESYIVTSDVSTGISA